MMTTRLPDTSRYTEEQTEAGRLNFEEIAFNLLDGQALRPVAARVRHALEEVPEGLWSAEASRGWRATW